VLPAWDGSKTALAGSKSAMAGENLAIKALYRPLSLFRNRYWQSPGRYHKKIPISLVSRLPALTSLNLCQCKVTDGGGSIG
jgi:hypothetical protein